MDDLAVLLREVFTLDRCCTIAEALYVAECNAAEMCWDDSREEFRRDRVELARVISVLGGDYDGVGVPRHLVSDVDVGS